MCHLSMKLSDTFGQNPSCTFENFRKTHSDEKRSHGLTLKTNVKVIAKIKSQCPREQKACLPKKISAGVPLVIGVTLTRRPMRTSVKQYVDPHPMGGRHNQCWYFLEI